jgi:hypothetical protein
MFQLPSPDSSYLMLHSCRAYTYMTLAFCSTQPLNATADRFHHVLKVIELEVLKFEATNELSELTSVSFFEPANWDLHPVKLDWIGELSLSKQGVITDGNFKLPYPNLSERTRNTVPIPPSGWC